MKKLLIALALAICSTSPVIAQQSAVDTRGLSESQVAEIMKQVAEMKEQKGSVTNISSTVRQEAEAWGEMGANMGKAMVGAAKEVGVAANEFSQTPLGKIVVFLVAYKLIGHDALSILFGALTLFVGTSLAFWLAKTNVFYGKTFEYKPFLFGLWNRKVVSSINVRDDIIWAKYFGAGALIVLSWLVGLNIIF